jgi:cysteine desulfurase/selenocysteine lyase
MYAMDRMEKIPNLHMIGTAPDKISVLAFIIDGIAPDKIGHYLDQQGIAVRAGHHCAQPILKRYGLTSSVRASLGLYNTKEEIDYLIDALCKIAKNCN